MSKLNNLKRNVIILVHSLFRGMASADDAMSHQVHGSDSMEINQSMKRDNVMQDFIDQRETQRVQETRDAYYRILKEADKYDASRITLTEDENGHITFDISKGVRKKDKSDFMKHPPVYEEEGYKLRTIQDNKHLVNHNAFITTGEVIDEDYFGHGLYDYQTTLTVERDGFIPRFELDKFITKMVVKNSNTDPSRAHVDFYLPTMASQFGKIDAILISNLNQFYNTKNFRSDILDFKTIEWYSDKAWNSDDVCLFKYDDCKPVDMCVFDGSFVITYDCNIISDGKYIAEKYKTKELTEKYERKAPKGNSTGIEAILRKMDKEDDEKSIDFDNLGRTTLKLS